MVLPLALDRAVDLEGAATISCASIHTLMGAHNDGFFQPGCDFRERQFHLSWQELHRCD